MINGEILSELKDLGKKFHKIRTNMSWGLYLSNIWGVCICMYRKTWLCIPGSGGCWAEVGTEAAALGKGRNRVLSRARPRGCRALHGAAGSTGRDWALGMGRSRAGGVEMIWADYGSVRPIFFLLNLRHEKIWRTANTGESIFSSL